MTPPRFTPADLQRDAAVLARLKALLTAHHINYQSALDAHFARMEETPLLIDKERPDFLLLMGCLEFAVLNVTADRYSVPIHDLESFARWSANSPRYQRNRRLFVCLVLRGCIQRGELDPPAEGGQP